MSAAGPEPVTGRAVEAALAPVPPTPRPSPRTRSGARSGSSTARSRASPRRESGGWAFAPGSTTASATPMAPNSATRACGIARDAVEAARIADPDEFAAAPPRAATPAARDRRAPRPRARRVDDRAQDRAGEGHRGGRPPGRRPHRRRRDRGLRRRGAASGDRFLGRPGGSLRGDLRRTPICRRSPRPTATSRPASASAWAARRRPSTPRRSGARAGRGRRRCWGPTKPASRSCPVVLDPTVAASFVGFIGGTLCANAIQRGRSPFADRLGDTVGSPALTLTDHAIDPAGLNSSPFDAEGAPARPHAAHRCRQADRLPPRRLHRPPPGPGHPHHRQRLARRVPLPALGLNLQPGRCPGRRQPRGAPRGGGDGIYVTDVAGLHSGVNPVSGTFSVGATGRLISGGALAAAADEFTIASDLHRC